MIGKRIRHTKRYQEVINAFMKNGFSHFLFRLGLTDRVKGEKRERTNNLHDIGKRLRETLQSLGPTFIKLGQIASSRRDIVPKEIAKELEKLQDDVNPFPYEQVKSLVEQELAHSIADLFQHFDKEPLATASIGQVHIAQLFDGKEVAVKVQRPDIEPIIETDLEILLSLAQFLENRSVWARTYRVKNIIIEFSNSLRNELNYIIEGQHAERIAAQFVDHDHIYIPKIFWKRTTNKVLTMERMEGIKINQIDELKAKGYNLSKLARELTDAMFKQVLTYGFFHGDPHAGNLFILPNQVIAFIDFGMVGKLSNDLKYHFASLLISLEQGDTRGIIKTFSKMDILDDDTNIEELSRDIETLQTKYYQLSFNHISLGKILLEIFTIAFEYRIKIPSDITILAKVILSLESIVGKLDPTFSIMKAVEPYGKKLLRERYHPKHILKEAVQDMVENAEILSDLPKDIKDVTSTIKKGKFTLDIQISELKSLLRRFDKISNRLSFSIILLAFSILMAGLIIGSSISHQRTLIWNLPVIEIGSVIATLMFLFMIYSILKSGRM